MKYSVFFQEFTKRHYINSLSKKYKSAWDKTFNALLIEFAHADVLFEKTIAEKIIVSDEKKICICKSEFKIIGTQVSRHASGLRCIFAIHKLDNEVRVLLVYHKNDLGGSGNETAKWKNLVKENYPEYKDYL